MSVSGSCHCGATKFEIVALPESLTTCTCTFCSKRGMLWGYYPADQVTMVSETARAIYNPSVVNLHHFCAVCGCGTYSETPDWSSGEPDMTKMRIGINARLLDDVDLKSIPHKEIDGRNLW